MKTYKHKTQSARNAQLTYYSIMYIYVHICMCICMCHIALVSAYCKPHLLYVTESLNLSATEIRSLQHICSVLYHIYSMFLVRILILCVVLWMTSR